ncbi:MAG: hypothetical protein LQ340_003822 [Diploschistes diacapsis]|nr:MAG: hypothetical protein LQ340_003822 [Diploschistes diacapsis]
MPGGYEEASGTQKHSKSMRAMPSKVAFEGLVHSRRSSGPSELWSMGVALFTGNANANKPKQDKPFLRSCEPCRTAKAKCVPVADAGVKECESRVAEVEKKLDNIYALLQANRHPESTNANTAQVPSPVSSADNSTGTLNPFVLRAIPAQGQTLTPPASDCRGDLRRRLDVVDKGVLTVQEAEELLRVYQDVSRDYPFIYIDPTTSLETIRWEKPFLLLSVLVMTSQRARSLQVLLERELRDLLSMKVIVEGELSLDLLQGLLVYLAWYHQNFRPCRQQLYQLTQLAVSMVIDLEIGRPSGEKTGFVLHPVRACLACKKDTAVPITSESEAKRTFIGAYYLTSALAIILRKPNGLAYTKHVEQCALELAENKEAPMDEYLIHYIRIQRLAEEVGIMFGYSDYIDEARLSPERIQLSVRAFMANLQEIEISFPPEVKAMPTPNLTPAQRQ